MITIGISDTAIIAIGFFHRYKDKGMSSNSPPLGNVENNADFGISDNLVFQIDQPCSADVSAALLCSTVRISASTQAEILPRFPGASFRRDTP